MFREDLCANYGPGTGRRALRHHLEEKWAWRWALGVLTCDS